MTRITRRNFGTLATGALLARTASAQPNAGPSITRAIPSTGERVPAVGLGTAYVFDRNDEQTRQAAAEIVRTLLERGGRLIDTASTYGDAEIVLGTTIASEGLRDRLFVATKLEAPDRRSSSARWHASKRRSSTCYSCTTYTIRDNHWHNFKAWKAQGICRYIGVTSTFHRDFSAMEAVIGHERPDFLQVDYSLADREAQKRMPLAAEIKAGVLTAQPFASGRLFRAVRGKTIPDWASDFAGSWAQFFLKYLLADERVTTVIPGTSNPAHMADNLGAMYGRLPDQDQRNRMVAFIDGL
jgi:aryl-alcohol dehydrogenase-like predicted oxidoreductase